MATIVFENASGAAYRFDPVAATLKRGRKVCAYLSSSPAKMGALLLLQLDEHVRANGDSVVVPANLLNRARRGKHVPLKAIEEALKALD